MVGTGPPLYLMSDSSQNGHLSVKNISEFLQTALAAELSWTRGSLVSITSHFKGEEIIMRVKNINGDCRNIVIKHILIHTIFTAITAIRSLTT